MEITTISEELITVAPLGEVIVYNDLKEINKDFIILLEKQRINGKKELNEKVCANLSGKDAKFAEVLVDKLVDIIFDNTIRCHKKVYN